MIRSKVAYLVVLLVFVLLSLFLVFHRSQPRNFVLSHYHWSSANAPKWISGKEITTNVLPDTDTTKLASISGKEERETFHGPGVDVTTKITKSFLYLTQTEECLPAYLLSNDTLGDPSLCNCDVIILSYIRECKNSSHPHVQNIFAPIKQWSVGRNLLYTTAMNRTTKYIYYVLMDDDMSLAYKPGYSGSNPWRELEESVLRDRPPAVGMQMVKYKKAISEMKGKPICLGDFVPTCAFDPIFSIFHHNAISNILPYHTEYNKESWWYATDYFNYKAGFLYNGHVVVHSKIYVWNPLHRPYPRGGPSGSMVTKIIKDIKKEVMEQFPDRPELVQRDCVKDDKSLYKCYCTGQKSLCPKISFLEWR